MSDREIGNKGDEQLPRPVINADECKSCGRCIVACPKACLRLAGHLNARGVRPVEYTGRDCIGCAACYYNCPEPYTIIVEKP